MVRVTVQSVSCLAWWCLVQRQAVQVALVGGAAESVRGDVVDVAASGWLGAAGEAAGAVSGDDVLAQVGWGAVGGAGVVEEVAVVVGGQSSPGAGGVGGDA